MRSSFVLLLCLTACAGEIGGPSPQDQDQDSLRRRNQPPRAFATSVSQVTAGATVQLDGAQSTDPDGRLVSYRWSQGDGPGPASFDDATAVSPTVSNLAQGTYRFLLTVTDNRGASDTDFTDLLVLPGAGPVANLPPTANAGADATLVLPASATLSGSGSDSDGSVTQYAWVKKSGGAASLSNAASATTTVTGLVAGTYVFTLTVTDDDGATASDDVQLTVTAAPMNPATRVCATATEWDPYPTFGTLTLTCPAGTVVKSISFASYGAPGGTCGAYTVDASCHAASSVSTLQALCVGKASCSVTDLNTVFGDPCSGTLKRLSAQAECGPAGPAANLPPLVQAGADRVITLPTTSVVLSGSASDSDGTVTQYAWSKKSGGAASLPSAASASTTVSGLAAGTYVFTLTATDDDGAAASDDVQVTVSPAPSPNPGTVALSFSPIAASSPDLVAPGRGLEIWHGVSQAIDYPTDGAGPQSLDFYFRFTWAELETARDVYDWSRFDQQLRAAITAGQKVAFGVMTVCPGCGSFNGMTTFAGVDASYPAYLHADMQAEAVHDFVSPQGGGWIPNWNSAAYLSRFEKLLREINQHLETSSHAGVPFKNAIHYIDVRGYGAWGEWHSGGIVSDVRDASEQPQAARATAASLNRIIDAHVSAFPNHQLVAMISTFDANRLQNTMNPPEVAYHALAVQNARGPLGWRRDNWGCLDSRCGDYLRYYSDLHPDPALRALIMNRWQTAPINGEPMNGGQVVGDASGAGCYYADLKTQVERYHASSFGNGNFQGVTSAQCARDNVRAAAKASGYRLVLNGGAMTPNVGAARTLQVRLDWRNVGLTPTYEDWNVTFELRSAAGAVAWSGTSTMTLRRFLPAAADQQVTDAFTLPAALAPGSYALQLVVRDPNGFRKPLPLGILGRAADGSYPLGMVVVP